MQNTVTLNGEDAEFLKKYLLIIEEGISENLEEKTSMLNIARFILLGGVKIPSDANPTADKIRAALPEMDESLVELESDLNRYKTILDRMYPERLETHEHSTSPD